MAEGNPWRAFETIQVLPVDGAPYVLEVRLNRPDKRNSMTRQLWKEVGMFFEEVADDPSSRCILLTGAGPTFSAGIHLQGSQGPVGANPNKLDVARRALRLINEGGAWQRSWNAVAQCGKPVIACIQKGCMGAALELVAHADIRFCTADAFFVAPEVDLAVAADIGGLHQLPKIVNNDSLLRELMLSGRRMLATEAKEFGLVSRICKDQADMMQQAIDLARIIAEKSPVATHGIKTLLNFSRDHSVQDSGKYAILWNAAMVQSKDIQTAGTAFMKKEKPVFEDIGERKVSKL